MPGTANTWYVLTHVLSPEIVDLASKLMSDAMPAKMSLSHAKYR